MTPRTRKAAQRTETARNIKFGCVRCGWIGRASRLMLERGVPNCPTPGCASYGRPMASDFPSFMTAEGRSREAAYAVAKAAGVPSKRVTTINKLRDELNAAEGVHDARRRT